jgi:hypothetical protein
MKKIIIASGILLLLTSVSANAQISVQAIFGEPQPGYVEAPAYGGAYPVYPSYAVEAGGYHDHHRDHGRRGGGHGRR